MSPKRKGYKLDARGELVPTQTTGAVPDAQEKRSEEKRQAIKQLYEVTDTLILSRPIFFVPGWTGEEGDAWSKPYPKRKKDHISAGEYFGKTDQEGKVFYITFSVKESEKCESFLDFANIIKKWVWSKIGKETPFDIVGHSMGGLDIVAAIIQDDDYLGNIKNCITVASPLRGVDVAEFIPRVKDLLPFMKKLPAHHRKQCENLDSDYDPIKIINTIENRERLLERVNKFSQFYGTQDPVVMKSAVINERSLPKNLFIEKVQTFKIEGANHSGPTGITQDPRVILKIINIVTDRPIDKPIYNYGFIKPKRRRV